MPRKFFYEDRRRRRRRREEEGKKPVCLRRRRDGGHLIRPAGEAAAVCISERGAAQELLPQRLAGRVEHGRARDRGGAAEAILEQHRTLTLGGRGSLESR